MEPPRAPDSEARASDDARERGAVEQSLPLIEERVRVDKVAVDQGGYRISKHVDVREEIVDEQLLRDEVRIERRPIGTTLPAGSRPVPYHDGDTLVIPVLVETVVVEKRLLLVEEVRITRTATKERARRPVLLRAERVEIERLEPEAASEPPESGHAGQATRPPRGPFSQER